MYEATERFYKVITGFYTIKLIRWIKRLWTTNIITLKAFMIGMKKKNSAIRYTIRLNITNGITERYANKFKAVKQLMYGKTGIELQKNKLVLEHILFN